MLKVRLVRSRGGGAGSTGMIGRGGRMLGEIEEYFIEGLVVGDTFVFGGEMVRYEALVEDQVYVSRANDRDAKVPSYMGGKFPLSTYLAERVRKLLDDRRQWNALPEQVRDWLSLQRAFFPRAGRARAPDRNLSARRQALLRLLSLRGTARAPDARHAADAAAGARPRPAARLCRQRICARDLGRRRHLASDPARQARSRRVVRSGHAGRRSRGVACRNPR